jgi:hypothetical protein
MDRFGASQRQKLSINESTCVGYYNIGGAIGKSGDGFTFGEKLPRKTSSNYPSPNKYFPPIQKSHGAVFMPLSKRP